MYPIHIYGISCLQQITERGFHVLSSCVLPSTRYHEQLILPIRHLQHDLFLELETMCCLDYENRLKKGNGSVDNTHTPLV